jgi:hypothetical protein
MSRGTPQSEKPADASRERAPAKRSTIVRDLLLIFGAFLLASAIAGALGAVNLGTALSFGQIGLAVTVVYVLLRR